MPSAVALSKKVRTKFIDHLDTVLVGEMITKRFNGPFVSLRALEHMIDRRKGEGRDKKGRS